MVLDKINIPGLIIDAKEIYALQEKLRPVLAQIDAQRQALNEAKIKKNIHTYATARMLRYKAKLADRFKIRQKKTAEIEKMFAGVVADIAALSYVLVLKERLTVPDLCTLHQKIYPKGLWGATYSDNFKRNYVQLYPTGKFRSEEGFRMQNGVPYFYLAPEYIEQAMRDIMDFLENEKDLHMLVRIILFTSWAGYAHPFHDGNGTVLRLFIVVLLLRNGYLFPAKLHNYASCPDIISDLTDSREGRHENLLNHYLQTFL